MFQFSRGKASGAPADPMGGFYSGPPSPDWAWTPRVVNAGDYPYDLDGSTRYTRPRRGIQNYFPYPYIQITADMGYTPQGWYDAFMPIGDMFVAGSGYARAFYGPAPNNYYSATSPVQTVAMFGAFPGGQKAG